MITWEQFNAQAKEGMDIKFDRNGYGHVKGKIIVTPTRSPYPFYILTNEIDGALSPRKLPGYKYSWGFGQHEFNQVTNLTLLVSHSDIIIIN